MYGVILDIGLGVALPVIELKNVSIKFDSKYVLQNVNVQVFEGEKLVLVGPSGQGKSVLLKLMAGLIKPTEGEVLINGENFETLPSAAKQKVLCKMGMLFQKNALFDSLTCGENIAFPLREASSLVEPEISAVVEKFLDAVGISHAKQLFPSEISGGMQKRLGIARALALNPEIVFYDDPTAGLDPITSRKIIELISVTQKTKKSTVIAVTNDMNRAYQLADKIGMVVDKTVLMAGNVEQTKTNSDARIQQFIHGNLIGPLTALQ